MSLTETDAEMKRALEAMLQAACPPVTDQIYGQPWSADTIDAFEDTVSRAQTLLDNAVSQAAVQANARNAINRLPTELLCMVFQFLLADTKHCYDDLLPLMRVCQHWHKTITSHAALWTNISISFVLHRNAERALSSLSTSLARAKNAPVDLTIGVSRRMVLANDCTSDLDASKEPIQAHMSHIRSLRINTITAGVFDGLWRVAFTMPAPQLQTLTLTLRREVPVAFPVNMFSGCAPQLQELNLDDINLPARDWPPLRGLKRITYRTRDSVNLEQFVHSLHPCTGLASVFLQCADLKDVHLSPARDTPPAPNEVHVIVMHFSLDLPDKILRMPWATLPARLSLSVKKSTLTMPWLDRFVAAPRTLSFCVDRVTAHSRTTTTVSATDASGNTRTLHAIGVYPLDTLTPYFGSISELTLSELLWPDLVALPSVPNLQMLTVDLMDPVSISKSSRYSAAGIFLLNIDPSQPYAWRFAQLHTIRLSYHPSFLASMRSPSVYIVSAHEVQLFFKWHLHSVLPLQLVLDNVELLEDMSNQATKALLQMVQSISALVADAAPYASRMVQ